MQAPQPLNGQFSCKRPSATERRSTLNWSITPSWHHDVGGEPTHLPLALPFLHSQNLPHPQTLLEIVGKPLIRNGIGMAKVPGRTSCPMRHKRELGEERPENHCIPATCPSTQLHASHQTKQNKARHREREGDGPRFNSF